MSLDSFDFYAGFFWGWLVAAVIVGRNRNTWRKAAEGWQAAAGSWRATAEGRKLLRKAGK